MKLVVIKRFLFVWMLCLVAVMARADQNTSLDKARTIALDFFQTNTSAPLARALQMALPAEPELLWDSRAVDVDGMSRVKTSDASDPTFYLFKNPYGKGFVFVSADEVSRPVIGYSLEDDAMQDDQIPDNMMEFLRAVNEEILAARASGKQLPAVGETHDDVAGKVVVNLKTATWGQRTPFNNFCPVSNGSHCATGCVPTAFAIILKYHEWPLVGNEVVWDNYGEQTDLSTHEYDWEKMLPSYADGTYTKEEGDAVALLMRDLGRVYQVTYGVGATGGNPSSVSLEALKRHFRYKDGVYYQKSMSVDNSSVPFTDEEWKALIKADLDAHRPIAYAATRNRDVGGVDGKHIFVLDGYTEKGYYHFNWGWNGSGNGYYTLDDMTPNADGSNYNKNHKAHFRLTPDRGDAPAMYTVRVTSNGHGSVYLGDTPSITEKRVAEGASVMLHAVPMAGYMFAGWKLDGKSVSGQADCQVVVTADAEYEATFVKEGGDPSADKWYHVRFVASGNCLTAESAGEKAKAEQPVDNSPAQLWKLEEVDNTSNRVKEYRLVNQKNIYLVIRSSVSGAREDAALELSYQAGSLGFRKEDWNGAQGLKGQRVYYYGKDNDFPISELADGRVDLVRSNEETNMVLAFDEADSQPPLPVRHRFTYTVNPASSAGKVSATHNGVEVQSGAMLPEGSDVMLWFQLEEDEAYRIQVNDGETATLDDDNFTVKDLMSDTHVSVEIFHVEPEMVELHLQAIGLGTVSFDEGEKGKDLRVMVEKNSLVTLHAVSDENGVFESWSQLRGTRLEKVSEQPDYELTAVENACYVASFREDISGIHSEKETVKVFVESGYVCIEGYCGEIGIYTVSGERLCVGQSEGEMRIPLDNGVYLVRLGSVTCKVCVKA